MVLFIKVVNFVIINYSNNYLVMVFLFDKKTLQLQILQH